MMKFSIIVAAYNVANYLNECVGSLAKQNFPVSQFEVLIINDGSTDEATGPLSDALSDKYDVVRVIHQKNGGLSAARNTGIQNAVGDYLLFVDGDDFWSDNHFLKKLSDNIEQNKSDIVIFSYNKFYDIDDIIQVGFETVPSFGLFSDHVLDLVSKEVLTAPAWNKCVKKELFNQGLGFPVGFLSEDCLYCANLLKMAGSFSILNSDNYMYRQNRDGSITNIVKEKNVYDILKSIDIGLKGIETYNQNLKTALEVYFTISYISILPFVNQYLHNKDIGSLLKKYQYLLKFSKKINNRTFKMVGIFTKIMGLSISIKLFPRLIGYYKKS